MRSAIDLAAALGVKAEIVETPFPERIPALMAGRVDVGVASTSDTLERAKTVGMSIPYFAFEMVVSANDKSGIKTFDDAGRLKSDVSGAELRHYPDTDTLEIDQALIRSYSLEGRLTTSTGNRALTNADGSEVQLFGNAGVVREAAVDAAGQEIPRLEFQGEFLHVFVNEERAKSHLPVVITRGNDKFSGDTFAYDNFERVADLKGRVKGVLVPRKAPAGAAR